MWCMRWPQLEMVCTMRRELDWAPGWIDAALEQRESEPGTGSLMMMRKWRTDLTFGYRCGDILHGIQDFN